MGGIESTTIRPPEMWKIWESAGQSRSASQPMRGETFAGSISSNPSGAGPPSSMPVVMRVRAEGDTAFERTP
jgi:hypothetical protein